MDYLTGGSQIVHRVTDWPGQKAQKGESKIPTLIYYDSNKQVSALKYVNLEANSFISDLGGLLWC